jgi:hypothetical protein
MSDSDRAEIKELVCTLFRAENPPGCHDDAANPPDRREVANKILADEGHYLPIIRGSGKVDKNRDETLGKFENPNPNFCRHVDQANPEVTLIEDGIAVARTLLPMTDSTNGNSTEVAFHNTHVFKKFGNQWKCIAWQVTKVQEKPPTG